jgi:phenylpropionate dioxygenase-like ring-hydroxylating dioxygenase large terminal subunit
MWWDNVSSHECLGALAGMVAVVWGTYVVFSKTTVSHELPPECDRHVQRQQTHKAPYPIGWYRLCSTRDVTAERVRSVDCLGQRLVVFRGRVNGRVSVLDAHCTHMGAHMGTGRVHNDCLACPFHGWEFDQDGVCRKIPYDTFSRTSCKIPAKSKIRSWPCVEKNDSVYLWYASPTSATATPIDYPSRRELRTVVAAEAEAELTTTNEKDSRLCDPVTHRFDVATRGSASSSRHRMHRAATPASDAIGNGDDINERGVDKIKHEFDCVTRKTEEDAAVTEEKRVSTKLKTYGEAEIMDATDGEVSEENKDIDYYENAETVSESMPKWALTELGAREMHVYHGQIRHQVSCHIQEIAENGADSQHLAPVHTGFTYDWLAWLFQHVWTIKWTQRSADGERHCADIELIHVMRLSLFGCCKKARDFCRVRANIVQDGPANVFMRLETPIGNVVLIQSVLPLAPNLQRVTEYAYSSSIWTRLLAKLVLHSVSLQLRRDIVIWNDKIMLEKPLLVKGDGPIMQFRTWMKQFTPPRPVVKIEYERELR